MKTPRFFILSGALALLFTIVIQTVGWTPPASADPLTIRRADPWAGDPDEPGLSRDIPFEEENFAQVSAQPINSELTTTLWRTHRNVLAFISRYFVGRRWRT